MKEEHLEFLPLPSQSGRIRPEYVWADPGHEVRDGLRGRCRKHYWPEDLIDPTLIHTTTVQMEADAG